MKNGKKECESMKSIIEIHLTNGEIITHDSPVSVGPTRVALCDVLEGSEMLTIQKDDELRIINIGQIVQIAIKGVGTNLGERVNMTKLSEALRAVNNV